MLECKFAKEIRLTWYNFTITNFILGVTLLMKICKNNSLYYNTVLDLVIDQFSISSEGTFESLFKH